MTHAGQRAAGPHDARCNVDDCGRKVHSRGMCVTHYNADYRRRNDNMVSNTHAGVVKTGVRGWGSLT